MRAYKIESDAFKRILQKEAFTMSGTALGSTTLTTVVQTLAALADLKGEREEVFLRYGFHEGAVVVDLGESGDRVVRVTAEGWKVLDKHPAKFYRANGMLPMPEPVPGGSLEELRELMQTPEDIWPLILAYLISSVNPNGPYFILMLEGDHGSGKTLLSSFLRQIVDPHSVPGISLSGDERDLMVTAEGNWLLNFDNLSNIRRDMSDALCRVATGGGLITRKLYSDADRQIFKSMRPMLMNGITAFASNPDLRDRAIFVNLPALAEDKRLPERALKAAFKEMQPRLLGALLDAVSASLRCLPEVGVPTSLRMVDAAHWVQAAERGLGLPEGVMVAAIKASQQAKAEEFSGLDEIFQALQRFLCSPVGQGAGPRWEFTGTIGQLMAELDLKEMGFATQRYLCNPQVFSNYLKRQKKEWAELGLMVEYGGKGRKGQRVRAAVSPEFRADPEMLAIVEAVKTFPRP